MLAEDEGVAQIEVAAVGAEAALEEGDGIVRSTAADVDAHDAGEHRGDDGFEVVGEAELIEDRCLGGVGVAFVDGDCGGDGEEAGNVL